ncbi:proteasome assembly chaperone 4-like [Neltuma alba]|uniref:proteasome assembly chaperone 4-like n=1 Tax=Neltuma alba TaxID=207710 RepID=UPI0010A2CBB9|nr:proteasome assembly chaperone 4-like [Prosopis alba]
MDSKELEQKIKEVRLEEDAASTSQFRREDHGAEHDAGLQITCFSEVLNDVTFHFQIIRFPKQIYVWIGYNSAKFGHMYAAAPTRPNNMVSATSILGGASDNTGSGIARRLVLKTGVNIILACDIPKNNPMLEADAEKLLIQKIISLGYTKSRMEGKSF